jgi:hypothetical protein
METKYISSTNIKKNHTWTHVAVLMESMEFKPAQVPTVILEVVLGKLYWKVALITDIKNMKKVRFQISGDTLK